MGPDLHAAVQTGDLAIVEALVRDDDFLGSRVAALDMAIGTAITRGHLAIAGFLVDLRERSQAPLHLQLVLSAARSADFEIARRVFDLVPDIAEINRGKSTPLDVAAARGLPETVELLLERGLDVNAVRHWFLLRPLHYSARVGRLATSEVLVGAGADLEAADRDGMTALAFADMGGHDEVAALLLERGANPETRTVHRRTALHRAAVDGGVAVVRRALAVDGDVNAKDLWGDTALHLVARQDRLPTIRVLLEAGADVNAQNEFGETPLVLAATDQTGKHTQTVRLLLESGTDPNLANGDGWNALHALVYMNDPELLQVAIAHGGEIEAPDKKGETPLLAAATYAHARCAKALVDAGADPTARDSENRSAADLLIHWAAMDSRDHEIAETARILRWATVDARQDTE